MHTINWVNNQLVLIDQRLLPDEESYLTLATARDTADAIRNMVVRGAPAIGITAAYGVVLAARVAYQQAGSQWREAIIDDIAYLSQSRPTAVNLSWAIQQMQSLFDTLTGDPEPHLLEHAHQLHQQDIKINQTMGDLGATYLSDHCAVLTHCNAGALATGGYGTALGVIRSAYRVDKIHSVYADETRPWLQGARLTAWELLQDNIPVEIIADSAAAHLMRQKSIEWVIVGADRVAANGDVANKIGTYHLAIAARYHGVKVMVVAPTSTIDMQLSTGDAIPIESRDPNEILHCRQQRIAATGATAWNPVFDITPASLVDVLITEKGAIEHPSTEKIQKLGV